MIFEEEKETQNVQSPMLGMAEIRLLLLEYTCFPYKYILIRNDIQMLISLEIQSFRGTFTQ